MLVVLALAAAAAVGAAQAPPANPAPLTLPMALAQARAASPLRGSAERLADGAATAARLARRTTNPVVDFRSENWSPGAAVQLPADLWATVSQPIELGGKRSARVGLANADHDVATTSLALVDRQLAVRTAELYIQALKARGLLDTLTANHEGLVLLTTTMRRRVEEGRSAEADLLKFAAESARVDIDIARARLELNRSLQALAFVIGAPSPIAAGQLVEPAPLAPPAASPGAVTQAASRHPEAVAAAARVERARRTEALERAKAVPDPVVTGGYKRTAGVDTVVAAVTVAVPLFDRNRSATARATGEVRAAEAEHDAVVRRLASETAALVDTALVLAERSSRAADDLLAPAGVVRDAALATFREGAADVLRLIDAERVYADVRRAALELRLEALYAALEARFALGEEQIP